MTNSPNVSDDTTAQLDQIFDILAHNHRRHALSYLIARDDGVASITELLECVGESAPDGVTGDTDSESTKNLQLSLTHIHLPKMDAAGIIDYDTRSETAHYHETRRLEQYLALAEKIGVQG
ncbi:hypothetical protein ACFFQF_19845 [Haladaptatus pallidirubidus]|uniref:DUF7344 domain-containing protein n=1 Tax=Haladaptatus pallidirubidus TaxID=1008152 RepID=A0AAV3UPX3_9EURY|nr:hypothetical protein [Haladaptatus pallidirubidus]